MNHHLSSLRDWLAIADTAQRQGTPRVLAAALTEIAHRATTAAREVIPPDVTPLQTITGVLFADGSRKMYVNGRAA